MANRSPPTPFIIGSITPSAALAAIAASTAEPPLASTAAPACDATVWLVATIPYWVSVIENACSRIGSRCTCATAEIPAKDQTNKKATDNFNGFRIPPLVTHPPYQTVLAAQMKERDRTMYNGQTYAMGGRPMDCSLVRGVYAEKEVNNVPHKTR